MEDIFNLRYALDTFYFLVSGALVMWMAAGFAMLEAGLVRSKNTAEILTKNVALYRRSPPSCTCSCWLRTSCIPADGTGYLPAWSPGLQLVCSVVTTLPTEVAARTRAERLVGRVLLLKRYV